jgi:hypothetical protein
MASLNIAASRRHAPRSALSNKGGLVKSIEQKNYDDGFGDGVRAVFDFLVCRHVETEKLSEAEACMMAAQLVEDNWPILKEDSKEK